MRYLVCIFTCVFMAAAMAAPPQGEGWAPLFEGEDLSEWTVSSGNDEIWTVKDGVIDCDPRMGAEGDNNLWSKEEFEDFQLYMEWRIKDTKGGEYTAPVLNPDGTTKVDDAGNPMTESFANADSGVYLRGTPKAQVNIWCWPIGSGEVYGYRTDPNVSPEVRAGVTPNKNADKPVGEWNTFLITMDGEELTVELNGETVLDEAQLPGVPESGPIALQHHGGYNPADDTWNPASSLVQFRNVYVRELPENEEE